MPAILSVGLYWWFAWLLLRPRLPAALSLPGSLAHAVSASCIGLPLATLGFVARLTVVPASLAVPSWLVEHGAVAALCWWLSRGSSRPRRRAPVSGAQVLVLAAALLAALPPLVAYMRHLAFGVEDYWAMWGYRARLLMTASEPSEALLGALRAGPNANYPLGYPACVALIAGAAHVSDRVAASAIQVLYLAGCIVRIAALQIRLRVRMAALCACCVFGMATTALKFQGELYADGMIAFFVLTGTLGLVMVRVRERDLAHVRLTWLALGAATWLKAEGLLHALVIGGALVATTGLGCERSRDLARTVRAACLALPFLVFRIAWTIGTGAENEYVSIRRSGRMLDEVTSLQRWWTTIHGLEGELITFGKGVLPLLLITALVTRPFTAGAGGGRQIPWRAAGLALATIWLAYHFVLVMSPHDDLVGLLHTVRGRLALHVFPACVALWALICGEGLRQR